MRLTMHTAFRVTLVLTRGGLTQLFVTITPTKFNHYPLSLTLISGRPAMFARWEVIARIQTYQYTENLLALCGKLQ